MTRYRAYRFLILVTAVIVTACNEPFSPKGPFEQRFVAYAILDAGNNRQYVRLSMSYNPPDYNPNNIPDNLYDSTAQVTIASSTRSFVFHDTLLGPSLHAFVSDSFSPVPGTSYALTATSPRGTIGANTTVPGHGVLGIPDQSALLYPGTFANGNIGIQGQLGTGTKGFFIRFILVYSLTSDTSFRGRIEIPTSFDQNSAGVSTPVYPQLQRNTETTPVVDFPVSTYLQVVANLTSQYTTRILLRQAKFYLVQVDEGLYNYYNIVNGFQDKYSIRTDQPDYTNIQNGYGVFGSFVVDSISVDLPRSQ